MATDKKKRDSQDDGMFDGIVRGANKYFQSQQKLAEELRTMGVTPADGDEPQR